MFFLKLFSKSFISHDPIPLTLTNSHFTGWWLVSFQISTLRSNLFFSLADQPKSVLDYTHLCLLLLECVALPGFQYWRPELGTRIDEAMQ
jgi:hypothetical protein